METWEEGGQRYSSLGRETGGQVKSEQKCSRFKRQGQQKMGEKMDMVGMSGKAGVTLGVLLETSVSVMDLGCNTNQL